MKQKRKNKGISLLEVLLSAGLFTIVILGISQTVMLMHRYSRANICKTKAHLLATSYFESILHDTHPYELNISGSTVSLRNLKNPSATINLKVERGDATESFFELNNFKCSLTEGVFSNLNTFTCSIYDESSEFTVYMLLLVKDSPLYDFYLKDVNAADSVENSLARQDINPPEGFQALRLKYWFTDPFTGKEANSETVGSPAYLEYLSGNELYAIRPIQPDDPEYDT